MSKGSLKGKVVIEEEIEEDAAVAETEELNNSVKSIDIQSKIVVEEGFYAVDDDEDDGESSNMSMVVDGDDIKPSGRPDNQSRTVNRGLSSIVSGDDGGSGEALDLSFMPCSIPLKKRKISSLPNVNSSSGSNNVYNEDKRKSDSHQHLSHHKIVTKDIPSAFNQLTDNRLDSFNLQSNLSPFPFTLRATPSATSSSSSCNSSSSSNYKPLSLIKNQQPHQQQLQHYQQQQQLALQQKHPQHDSSFGNKSSSSNVGSSTSGQTKGMSCRRPGFITCSICNATKYYSHVQRRFGQYSCEPCSKFMKRFLRDPKIFTCSQKGHCTIGKPSGEQEPRGVSVNRCKACWLKICLEKFILDSGTRLVIDKYYAPKFDDSSSTTTSSTASSISGGASGSSDGRDSAQSCLSDRMETNDCDSTLSPPPLPFPQRKRKPKSEATSSSMSTSASSTTTTATAINQSSQGEIIPLTTATANQIASPVGRKDGTHQLHHHSHHHHDSRIQRESSPFFSSNLLSEPLCLTTGRREAARGQVSGLPSPSSSSSLYPTPLGLSHPLSSRYPWSHRRKDDYDLLTLSSTTAFRPTRDLNRKSHDMVYRRSSDDDLNDLYQSDYSPSSSGLAIGYGTRVVKDINGDGDEVLMASPLTPPLPPARCGKCSFCRPTIDEKANVVVVKENCGPVRCRLAELTKLSQSSSSDLSGISGGLLCKDRNSTNSELKQSISATSECDEDEDDADGESDKKIRGRHDPFLGSSPHDHFKTNKHRRDLISGSGTRGGNFGNCDSNDELKSILLDHRHRRSSSGQPDDDDNDDGDEGDTNINDNVVNNGDDNNVSTASEHLTGSQSDTGNGNNGNDRKGSRTSDESSTNSKSQHSHSSHPQTTSMSHHRKKTVMFNKPYKKILINEHFVNPSSNQSKRDLTGPVISSDSNFLNEILNTNSPFL